VNAIIFLCPVSAFDEVVEEDAGDDRGVKANRLVCTCFDKRRFLRMQLKFYKDGFSEYMAAYMLQQIVAEHVDHSLLEQNGFIGDQTQFWHQNCRSHYILRAASEHHGRVYAVYAYNIAAFKRWY
jgi:hypothetical protein